MQNDFPLIKIKKDSPYAPLYDETDGHFIILITGGRGSAKSFNSTLFISRLSFEKGHKILFSRYTMSAAAISIIPEFLEKLEMDGTHSFFNVTKSEIINKFSGSEIIFKGIKTSSGNQTANLKSINGITTFVGDEMEEWISESDYDKLRLSIRKKGIRNRVILILNPTTSDHFIYKKYIEKTHRIVEIDGVEVQISTHPDVLHIHTTYLDNVQHLSDEFLKDVERIKHESLEQSKDENGVVQKHLFNKSKYAYQIIGKWADVAEGVIFTNVSEGKFDDSLPYGYGMDFGFVIDPDTLIKCAVDEKQKKIYLHEEYYDRKQLSTEGLSEMIKSRIGKPNDLIVADSAEPRLISDLRASGLNIEPCQKGAGSVTAGIMKMQEYEIIVTPESHNLKKEFRNYAWNDKRAGIPNDSDNHGIDSARYISQKLIRKPNNNLRQIASLL